MCDVVRVSAFVVLLALAPAAGPRQAAPADTSASEAREALARLQALEGTWRGPSTDAASGAVYAPSSLFVYRLTGGGSTLTEHANAGTPEEMLSVFFVDDDRLLLQHYCSAGNQPLLELRRVTDEELVFELAGGHGFDASADGHIHRARFVFPAEAPAESYWSWYQDGNEHHVNRRVLAERIEEPALP